MNAATWSLGAIRNIGEQRREFKLDSVRELSEEEFEGFVTDVGFLKSLGGHNLVAALDDKFNAVVQVEVEILSNPHQLQDTRFSYRVASVVDAFLGELTTFRSRIQSLADQHVPEYSERLREIFGRFYADNANYRLAWELRNSSQHGAGATHHFQLKTSVDSSRWVIDLSALFADHRGEKRWEATAALWGTTDLVNVTAVLHGAWLASSKALAVLLVENELSITTVIERIAQAIAEGVGSESGSAAVWSTSGLVDSTVNVNQVFLEPIILGYAIGSLQGARKTLGLSPSTRFPAGPAAGRSRPRADHATARSVAESR